MIHRDTVLITIANDIAPQTRDSSVTEVGTARSVACNCADGNRTGLQ